MESRSEKTRFPTNDQAGGAVDITDAVHSRMVVDSARESLATRGHLSAEENGLIFCRLLPSMREEAQFWFFARGERGAVICSVDLIEYVPERHLKTIDRIRDAQDEIKAAISSYDPFSEAVVVFTDEGVSKIVITGERTLLRQLGA
jgi:hypothetical protein